MDINNLHSSLASTPSSMSQSGGADIPNLLRFDRAKIRNSEDELIVSSLESSYRMLKSSRARILDNLHYRLLSDKEQSWLVELEQQEQRLVEQARQAGLLLEDAQAEEEEEAAAD